MTTANILELKKQRLERQMNRLHQQEALVKQLERKERTRRLIEMGGLVAKVKLDELGVIELYGALISLAEQKDNDSSIIDAWRQKGQVAFDKDNQDKVAVIVSFEEKPSAELRAQIRELGLKWNNFRKEWQGKVELKRLKEELKGAKHTLTQVG